MEQSGCVARTLGGGKGQTVGCQALKDLSRQGTNQYSLFLLQPAPGEPIYVTVLLGPDISLAFYCLPCKHHKEPLQLFLIPSERV